MNHVRLLTSTPVASSSLLECPINTSILQRSPLQNLRPDSQTTCGSPESKLLLIITPPPIILNYRYIRFILFFTFSLSLKHHHISPITCNNTFRSVFAIYFCRHNHYSVWHYFTLPLTIKGYFYRICYPHYFPLYSELSFPKVFPIIMYLQLTLKLIVALHCQAIKLNPSANLQGNLKMYSLSSSIWLLA